MRRLPLSAALVCLLCSGLMARGTFPLKYTEATGDLAFVAAVASRDFGCLPEKPSAIKGVTDGLQKPVGYYHAGFGGEGYWASARPLTPPPCLGGGVGVGCEPTGGSIVTPGTRIGKGSRQ